MALEEAHIILGRAGGGGASGGGHQSSSPATYDDLQSKEEEDAELLADSVELVDCFESTLLAFGEECLERDEIDYVIKVSPHTHPPPPT